MMRKSLRCVPASLGLVSLASMWLNIRLSSCEGIKTNHQKTLAGYKCIDDFVVSGMCIGLGSGSTVSYALKRLAERLKDRSLSDITVIPCSEDLRKKCISMQIPTALLSKVDHIDLFIDGADEIDPMLNMVKGASGSILREKMVHNFAQSEVIIVDESKLTKRIGPGVPIPVEITPYAHELTRKQIEKLPSLEGCRAILRRGLVSNHIPDGPDVSVTDSGNFIVDLYFDGPINDIAKAVLDLDATSGVVEHGLLLNPCSIVLVAGDRGVKAAAGPATNGNNGGAWNAPWWGDQPVKQSLERQTQDNRRPE